MKNISFTQQLLINVLVTALVASAISFQIAKDTLNQEKQFKVVDMKQLSEKTMLNLAESLKEQKQDINPEIVQVIAKNEAKKLFQVVANVGGENDIILPKSAIIHAPLRYEITEQVAEQMGLTGVVAKDLTELLTTETETPEGK